MSTIRATLKNAILEALRDSALVADLRANPALLDLVGDVTLASLCGDSQGSRPAAVKGKRGRPKGSGKGAAKAAAAASSGGKPEVRTQAGRVAYDAKVLAAVKSSETGAAEHLLAVTGGDVHQLRAALHRLMKAKKVKRTGKTRATRYSAS